MVVLNYDSPKEIKHILEQENIGLKKRWGQNFLINSSARAHIIQLLSPVSNEHIWEIGPGLGALTKDLLLRSGKLTVFEIDWGLIRFLRETYGDQPNFCIIGGDVLKTWKEAVINQGTPDAVVGNLPYSSAAAIILTFIHNNFSPSRMVFTVQKETAQRMSAQAGEVSYSSFSVLCGLFWDIALESELHSGSFFPPPDVVSRVVKITPRTSAFHVEDITILFSLIQSSFSARRKTIKNNLKKSSLLQIVSWDTILQAFTKLNIDLGYRGEMLSVSDYVNISNELYNLEKSIKA
jgi:16S rRNA (adenine1518-N6/adenine1519-N6)-dimethyltransferase